MPQSGTITLGCNIEQAGIRAFDPNAVTQGVAQDNGRDSQRGIVASTVQTAAGASATAQMIYGLNHILTCVNASDAVALPPAVRGAVVHFYNSGAQTCKVFGKAGTTDTINGTAGATGVTGPGADKMGIAICTFDGAWRLGLTA